MLTLITLKTWILTLMIATGDSNATWKDTYENTATLFAESAMESPLFCEKGQDKAGNCPNPTEGDVRRTAALYVSISWFESRHNPKAEGDGRCWRFHLVPDKEGQPVEVCDIRTPPQPDPRYMPHSFCLGQINDSNFTALNTSAEELLSNTKVCVKSMNTLMRVSFKTCKDQPFDYKLSQYTAGGATCVANRKSMHRMQKALWLFKTIPMKPVLGPVKEPEEMIDFTNEDSAD